MLIVSKFHDYYDTASSFGIDKNCLYKRKTTTSNLKAPSAYPCRCESERFQYEGHFRAIGFCGKIFPLIEIQKYLGKELMETDFIYSLEDSIRYFEMEKISDKYRYRGLRAVKADLKRFFDKDQSSLEKLFFELKVPVFVFGHKLDDDSNLILNPELGKLKFFRVKDAHSAFQDIFMFLSGVLGAPPRPTVEIADKYKQEAKGHDGPYSFKKPPGKKVKWR